MTPYRWTLLHAKRLFGAIFIISLTVYAVLTGYSAASNWFVLRAINGWKNLTLDAIAKEYIMLEDDFKIKPNDIQFLVNHTNPCWKRKNSSIVDCLPAFYIAAFPKCSTTDLWERLIRHPQIAPGREKGHPFKELTWWTYTRFTKRVPFQEYMSYFRDANSSSKVIAGDATTATLFQNYYFAKSLSNRLSHRTRLALTNYELVSPHLIVQYTPNAKFIVMMREPVARLYSHYHQHRREQSKEQLKASRYDPEANALEFHRLVLKELEGVGDCLKLTPHSCAREYPHMPWIQIGSYAALIRNALKLVPRKNMLFVHFDEYTSNRSRVIPEILRFLGVSDNPDIVKRLSALSKKDTARISESDRMPMLPETKRLLTDLYRPLNKDLAEWFKRSEIPLFTNGDGSLIIDLGEKRLECC